MECMKNVMSHSNSFHLEVNSFCEMPFHLCFLYVIAINIRCDKLIYVDELGMLIFFIASFHFCNLPNFYYH